MLNGGTLEARATRIILFHEALNGFLLSLEP
jgi:hypothetical protein